MWTELDHVYFEQSLLHLADQYVPMSDSAQDLLKRHKRQSKSCPGGNGKFGFNTFSMLTGIILGFNAVSNVIANINNNLNNNNDNNNIQDSGNVQGTSQDVDLMSTSMTMVITIVPPVGPPVPVLVGRAIKRSPNSTFDIYLNDGLEKEGVYFETEDATRLFPNGTILYSNGTKAIGEVFYGAVDSRQTRKMKYLHEVLNMDDHEISLKTLIHLNSERKARQNRHEHSMQNKVKMMINRAAKNYFEILDSKISSPFCKSMELKHLHYTLGLFKSPIQC